MRFFDLQTDYFIPIHRRYVLIAFCMGWGLFEFYTRAPFWGIVFMGMGALAIWQFFFDSWPSETAGENDDKNDV